MLYEKRPLLQFADGYSMILISMMFISVISIPIKLISAIFLFDNLYFGEEPYNHNLLILFSLAMCFGDEVPVHPAHLGFVDPNCHVEDIIKGTIN